MDLASVLLARRVQALIWQGCGGLWSFRYFRRRLHLRGLWCLGQRRRRLRRCLGLLNLTIPLRHAVGVPATVVFAAFAVDLASVLLARRVQALIWQGCGGLWSFRYFRRRLHLRGLRDLGLLDIAIPLRHAAGVPPAVFFATLAVDHASILLAFGVQSLPREPGLGLVHTGWRPLGDGARVPLRDLLFAIAFAALAVDLAKESFLGDLEGLLFSKPRWQPQLAALIVRVGVVAQLHV